MVVNRTTYDANGSIDSKRHLSHFQIDRERSDFKAVSGALALRPTPLLPPLPPLLWIAPFESRPLRSRPLPPPRVLLFLLLICAAILELALLSLLLDFSYLRPWNKLERTRSPTDVGSC